MAAMRCPLCRGSTDVTNTEVLRTGTEVHRIRQCKDNPRHHFQTRETLILHTLTDKGLVPTTNDKPS